MCFETSWNCPDKNHIIALHLCLCTSNPTVESSTGSFHHSVTNYTTDALPCAFCNLEHPHDRSARSTRRWMKRQGLANREIASGSLETQGITVFLQITEVFLLENGKPHVRLAERVCKSDQHHEAAIDEEYLDVEEELEAADMVPELDMDLESVSAETDPELDMDVKLGPVGMDFDLDSLFGPEDMESEAWDLIFDEDRWMYREGWESHDYAWESPWESHSYDSNALEMSEPGWVVGGPGTWVPSVHTTVEV